MVVLGLILVLVAVVAGVVLVYENSGDHTTTLMAFGGSWTVDTFWVAVVGAAVLLVGVLGIVLIRGGGKRGLRRRQERKQLERENAALADRVRHTPTDDRVGRHDDPAARPDDGDVSSDRPPTTTR